MLCNLNMVQPLPMGCNGQSNATFKRVACEWEPHLLAVLLEFCCLRMFQGTCKRPNLVVVGPSLQRWKD